MLKLSTKVIFLILIFLVALMEAGADILFKKWSIDNRGVLLSLGLVLYLIATIIFAFSLKYEFLSKAISVYAILNTILIVAAGILLFNESLTSINKIGILLGIIAVVLIEL